MMICLAAAAAFGIVAPAGAQDKVAVRTGGKDGYDRLVFQWPSKPDYSVSKENGRVLVRFSRAGSLETSGVNAENANIEKIETLSKGDESLQVAVTIPQGSRFRDFVVDNKLIIDIYDSDVAAAKPVEEAPAEKAAVAEKPKAETAPLPPAERSNSLPAEDKASPKTETVKADFTKKAAEAGEAVPVGEVAADTVPPPAFEPHIITMTSTTNTGMTAYLRNGYLWLILDSTDVPGAPQLAGPQKDIFPPLTKVEITGGAAYRIEVPEGMKAYGEGGGLNWRIVLSAEKRDVSPVASLPRSAAAGKLVWPLKEMRKVLSFTDPDVGDKVIVVTATDAGQFTGASRNFVNLRTLDSVIGIALTPKSDDVGVEKTIADVSVGRPEGLALLEAKDVKPEEIRSAMEAEKKTAEGKAGEGKASDAGEKAEEGKVDDIGEKKVDAKSEVPLHPDPLPAGERGKDPLAQKEKNSNAHAVDAVKPQEEADAGHDDGAEAPSDTHDAGADVAHGTSGETLAAEAAEAAATKEDIARAGQEKPAGNDIYNFPRWEMGGVPALENNLHVMMVDASNKKEEDRTEDILTMAKLNLANDRGAEAIGLLRIALLKVPELEDNAEYEALRGAALALSGKYDEAFIDYSRAALKKYDDIKYWMAYTLAGLEDWKQAITVMPKDFAAIAAYPPEIRTPLALTFAEIALRGGDVKQATMILDMLKPDLAKLSLPYASSWNYLAGEAQRQSGDAKRAAAYWEPLVKNGKDDLFRAKAGLSLTKLQLDQKKINPAEAIDRLEGLRYAWRGDELETLINYRLGQIYIDNKDYLKGLTVLRNAASLSPQSDMGKDVNDYMTRSYREVFANGRLKNISPLEAISLHEEFKDLLPPGEEGDRYVETLAERLVDADLLGRAAALLEYQVNNRLQGDKKAEIAIRLAAIRLLDGNPDGALRSLDVAQDALDKIGTATLPAAVKPEEVNPEAGAASKPVPAAAEPAKTEPVKADPEKQRQIYLLRARALSMKKKTDEAMEILVPMRLDPDVNRLRTDIAWTAGRWDEAAMALNDLIVSEDISPKRPLTEYQRDIILNRAIALNLSGNRVALANLRERYNGQMKDTTKGQMFEVVTRPRRPDIIGSREAIESMISEIDMFKGFTESYAKMESARADGAKDVAAPKEALPVEGKTAAQAPATTAAETIKPAEETSKE